MGGSHLHTHTVLPVLTGHPTGSLQAPQLTQEAKVTTHRQTCSCVGLPCARPFRGSEPGQLSVVARDGQG